MAPKKLSGASDQQFEEISNPNLPNGWKRVIVKRQTGKTKDIYDIYIIAPDGKKLRSSIEYLKHVSKTKTPCRMSPEECVNLFKKAYLKAENFANHDLLIKLVPSLATQEERESMGISLSMKKRGRPKKISTGDNIADEDRLSPLVPTSRAMPQEENLEIGFKMSKRGRPKKVQDIANQDLVSKSGIRPHKADLGISWEPRKPGRPKKDFQAEGIANGNQLSTLRKSLESNLEKENLSKSVVSRKRGRSKSGMDKHFVLINQQSKLLSTLGKEPRIFKRRKRRARPKSENLSGEHESFSRNETEENCVVHQETRADKSVQTDDFLFTFKNVSNNFQSYDCINSQDNQQVIANVPTEMVFTSIESDKVGVPKRFTYLPSSISKMKWDSVSGTYAIDVDGKVIPGSISNDEEYLRMEDQDSGENSLSMSPDIKDFHDYDINIEDFEESKMCDMGTSRNYFIDHTSAVTICHRPKSRDSTWIPPKSPYNIIQQLLYDDPWKLLISTFFEECQDPKHFWEFVNKWPSAKELLRVNVRILADFLKECGIHRLRAGTFLKFSDDFLHTDWVDPAKLFGIRNFGRECYILFYLGEWQLFKPKSGMLKLYLNWYHENFVDK